MGCGASAKQKYEANGADAANNGQSAPGLAPAKEAASSPPASAPAKESPDSGAGAKKGGTEAKTDAGGAAASQSERVISDEEKALREKHPKFAVTFDTIDAKKRGKLGMKELTGALRMYLGKAVAKKQISALLKSVDANGDGVVDFREFVMMGEAFETGDVSKFPGVDKDAFHKMVDEGTSLKSKMASNLRTGLKTGELQKVCDAFPGDEAAPTASKEDIEKLRTEHADWAGVFDACDGEKAGTLTVNQLRQAMRNISPGVSGKQISLLHQAMDQDKSGTVDFAEFVAMAKAIVSGDLSAFPKLDAKAFQSAFSDTKAMRDKAKRNLVKGLRDGQLAKVVNSGELKEKYPAYCEAFELFDADNSGGLSFKELNIALRKASKNTTRAKVTALYKAMDQNRDGKIDLEEFCKMAEALATGDPSQFPGVDSENFKKLLDDAQKFRIKVSENLADGIKSGTFFSLMEQYDTEQGELRQKHPDCAEAFDAIDTDGSGALKVKEVVKAVRTGAQAQGRQPPPKKQITTLVNAVDQNGDGSIDFSEFVAISEAIKTGDLSGFPGVDAEAFKLLLDEANTVKKKAQQSLLNGLRSGEVKKIIDEVEGQ